MIVRDEQEVIARCLRSVLPLITTYSICDTGSVDRTKEIIREELKSVPVPGVIHDRPWVNFSHNRTEAFELAAGKAPYDLVIDADDVLEMPEGYRLPILEKDAYDVPVQHNDMRHSRAHIVRNNFGFRFSDVVHEYLDRELAFSRDFETLGKGGLLYRVVGGGSRHGRDPIDKFRSDAAILQKALLEKPDSPRYVFYLANTLRDLAGELARRELSKAVLEIISLRAEAAKLYALRSTMGGFREEVFVSLLERARLLELLHEGGVAEAYLFAAESRITRAPEALYHLARYFRSQSPPNYALAYLYAKAGLSIAQSLHGKPSADDVLFADPSIYAWRLEDEVAIPCDYLGHRELHEEGIAIIEKLLNKAPAVEHERLLRNLAFLKSKLL
jgi:glycosyltransferase involved in cell wall biosynthesis